MTSGDISALTSASMTYTKDNRLDTYNGQKVTYDLDGNMTYGPLNGVMTSFEYDCRNRLVKAGDTTYEYGAEDTRIAVQTKDRREEYIVDKNAVYSQVLSITGYEKNLIGQYTKETDYTIYTYGIGLISQESGRKGEEGTEENTNTAGEAGSAAAETVGTAYYLYHYNQAGSTTQVTDETGNIVYRYAYSPYGERMGTYDGSGNRISDDTPIRFLYNGQAGVETDRNGLYYMRARYYNTDIKRFLNRDILDGTIDNGQSLNKYSYVQGNPVTLTDPFGLCPVGGSMNDYLVMLGHTALDLLGFLPIVGFVAYLANAYWYYREGNTFQMAASIIAAIPGLGDAVGGIIKGAVFVDKCEKAVKIGKAVSTTCRMIGAIAQTGVNTINFERAFQSVKEEYRKTGHVSFLNGANAVLAGPGVVGGIAQSVSSIQNFDKMVSSLSSKSGSGSRNRIGNPVNPMDKTYEMSLNPELYANEVAKKYGINLKGSGQKVNILFNPELKSAGKTREITPNIIELGPSAFVSEEELANTIAHELNHARSFLKGGNAPEKGITGAYHAGDTLAEYIRGER